MSKKAITIPGVAYCTAPEGTKLQYGDKVNVLYSKNSGHLFVTDRGVFQSHRFSDHAPDLSVFESRRTFKRKAFVVVRDAIVTYKQAYEDLIEDAKRALRDGRTEEFCKQLIKQ